MAELGVHQSALLTDLALCVNRYRLFSLGWSVCVVSTDVRVEDHDHRRSVCLNQLIELVFGVAPFAHVRPDFFLQTAKSLQCGSLFARRGIAVGNDATNASSIVVLDNHSLPHLREKRLHGFAETGNGDLLHWHHAPLR